MSLHAEVDAAIDDIAALKGLKKVFIWQTKITIDGVAKLKKARPDLKIIPDLVVEKVKAEAAAIRKVEEEAEAKKKAEEEAKKKAEEEAKKKAEAEKAAAEKAAAEKAAAEKAAAEEKKSE